MEHQAIRRGQGESVAQDKNHLSISFLYNERRSITSWICFHDIVSYLSLELGKMVGGDWVDGACATCGVRMCQYACVLLHRAAWLVYNEARGHQ